MRVPPSSAGSMNAARHESAEMPGLANRHESACPQNIGEEVITSLSVWQLSSSKKLANLGVAGYALRATERFHPSRLVDRRLGQRQAHAHRRSHPS